MLEHIEIAIRALNSVNPERAPRAVRIGVAHDHEAALRMLNRMKARLVSVEPQQP